MKYTQTVHSLSIFTFYDYYLSKSNLLFICKYCRFLNYSSRSHYSHFHPHSLRIFMFDCSVSFYLLFSHLFFLHTSVCCFFFASLLVVALSFAMSFVLCSSESEWFWSHFGVFSLHFCACNANSQPEAMCGLCGTVA